VPGISSASKLSITCSRCGKILSGEGEPITPRPATLAESAAHGLDLAGKSPLSGFLSFDDWQIGENIRNLQARSGARARRLDRPARKPRQAAAPQRAPAKPRPVQRRIHAAHTPVPRPHRRPTRARRRMSFIDSIFFVLEMLAFAIGAALLGWSFVDEHAVIGSLGMPSAIAGQVGLLVGLVLQTERIWHNSRFTVRRLDQVGARLNDLNETTTMLNATHSSTARAFYTHLAEEADPEMLLADLKGQIDLLALSISRRSA
jgi:hypothetical protein